MPSQLLISKKSRRSREQAFVEFGTVDAAQVSMHTSNPCAILPACMAPHRPGGPAFKPLSHTPHTTNRGAPQAAIASLDGSDPAPLVKQPGCGGLVVRFADHKKAGEEA